MRETERIFEKEKNEYVQGCISSQYTINGGSMKCGKRKRRIRSHTTDENHRCCREREPSVE